MSTDPERKAPPSRIAARKAAGDAKLTEGKAKVASAAPSRPAATRPPNAPPSPAMIPRRPKAVSFPGGEQKTESDVVLDEPRPVVTSADFVEHDANVLVSVRMRPFNRLEQRTGQKLAWKCEQNAITQIFIPEASKTQKPLTFTFDNLFSPLHDNAYLFAKIGYSVVKKTMLGYHGCVFAYGQTSSGKTHTIHGNSNDPGMIPRSVEAIFHWIENTPDREFVLRVSYLEVYNEVINDLLEPSNTNMRIRESKLKGVYVENLKEDVVMTPDQVFSLISAGEAHRHIGRTNYNQVSSRSHTIFRVVVESQSASGGGAATFSVLNLVDLAGSENTVKAGSTERIKETGYINKSLLSLGTVIWKISESKGKDPGHIPYRNSKLTRILQSSLGGNAVISVICAVSPSSENVDESISTLKFAARAKSISNDAQVNEATDAASLIRKYKSEIERLRKELDDIKQAKVDDDSGPTPPRATSPDGVDPDESTREKEALKGQIEQLTRLILRSSLMTPDELDDKKNAGEIGRRRTARTKSMTMRPGIDFPRPEPDAGGSDQLCVDDAGVQLTPQSDSSPSDGKSEDTVDAYKTQIQMLKAALAQKDGKMQQMAAELENLREKANEDEAMLVEWDKYYVATSNKHAAITDQLKRIAASRRVPTDGTGGGQMVNVPLSELQDLLDTFGMDATEPTETTESTDDFNAPLVDSSVDPLADESEPSLTRDGSMGDSLIDDIAQPPNASNASIA